MANYYNITNLLKTKAQYMMLLGQRANGKSYQVKDVMLHDANEPYVIKNILERSYEGDVKFIYLRRWKEDIKAKSVEAYFGDMPIKKITKGKYDSVVAYNGFLYYANRDKNGDIKKGKEIGRYCALNEYERYKSQTFIGYEYIAYEEFITDGLYLYEEPRQLQQFVSTVARNRPITVFLIGNTLSRVCPYFSEWCLDGVLRQRIGTIDVYHHHMDDGSVIDIAVEYCANATGVKNTMFFGQTAKQIVSGEWDTVDVPKLPKSQDAYEKVYEVLVEYQKFKFVMELLVEKMEGGVIVFIYPLTSKREIRRKLTTEFSDDIFTSARLDTSKKPELMISECFKLGKVCYSDNLTGSDFKHVNENFKIGAMF